MRDNTRNGLIGALLIGVGCGMAAVGFAMVIPACANWSLGMVDEAVKRGRDTLSSGIETAASLAGHLSGKAQRKFSDASKSARHTTAKAAEAVETAARRVREHAS
ncbi:MAG: hypothetical protein JO211_03835 [Acidobacteriaceae bacterium]|nr:hypothetical protein [Acidobacteriaceae bacterium]